jgi:hypothetical protein
MLPSRKLIHMVLALAKAADLELLKSGKVLSTAKEQAAAEALADMLRGYDYLSSKQFEDISAVKSEAVIEAMRRDLSTPEKQRQKLMELYDAVRQLMDSDRIYDLLPRSREAVVTASRVALSALDERPI